MKPRCPIPTICILLKSSPRHPFATLTSTATLLEVAPWRDLSYWGDTQNDVRTSCARTRLTNPNSFQRKTWRSIEEVNRKWSGSTTPSIITQPYPPVASWTKQQMEGMSQTQPIMLDAWNTAMTLVWSVTNWKSINDSDGDDRVETLILLLFS